MNKFLVGFLVVLAGGAFGWYYLRPSDAKSPNVSEPATSIGATETPLVATTIVTYLDSGFAPVKITVKKGTAVTFTNLSAGNMWVAADVHPTHQLLPGFDQLKDGAKGATYEYVFAKVGTWTYHNHMNPSHLGTIVVTE